MPNLEKSASIADYPRPLKFGRPSAPAGTAFAVITVLFAVAGLIFSTIAFGANLRSILLGLNDFPQLYLGPKLLADHDLYSSARMMSKQAALLGRTCEHIQYVRLPFLAVLLWPLSLLPYHFAYALWQVCSAGALAGFIRLWRGSRAVAFAISCWFPPVSAAFANAQDVTFLLLWIALCTHLFEGNLPFAAGLVFALCAAKFHLFLFVPVLVVACRLWRFGLGLAAGSSILLAISFLAGGWTWPAAWYKAVLNPQVHPALAGISLVGKMSVVLSGPLLVAGVLALGASTACAVWICARRSSFALALSVAVAAGPLCAYHVYLQDYLLWLPLGLLVVNRAVRPDEEAGTSIAAMPSIRP